MRRRREDRRAQLSTVPTPDGKLTPDLVAAYATGFGNIQRRQPAVVSITQSTELGTVYTAEETAAVAAAAHERGLTVHMDGARIANAAASSASRCAPSPPTRAWTSCRSAAPRTACCSVRRSSS